MLRLETSALKATYTNTLDSAQATIAMLMVVAARRAADAAIDKLQEVTRCAANPYSPTCRALFLQQLPKGAHIVLVHT
jgi:hypothetical protein